jgi:hypothetical protein
MDSLKEKVMIVNLTISQWGARKYDRGATKEVEDNHQAKEAGRFNKVLMQSDTLTSIGKVGSKIRLYHYENTLPWGDNGDRILPTEKYFQYIMDIGMLKNEFCTLADKFIQEYETEKQRSMSRLNTLYNEKDYPQSECIRKKFDILVGFMPIADGNDLRVNMSEQVIGSIKDQITKELEKRIESTTTDILDRLKRSVQRMAETLKDKDSVFRDSLVGNIEALCENLPSLNFNSDAHIVEVLDWCKGLIVDPDDLRTKRKFRMEICAKAEQILANI